MLYLGFLDASAYALRAFLLSAERPESSRSANTLITETLREVLVVSWLELLSHAQERSMQGGFRCVEH